MNQIKESLEIMKTKMWNVDPRFAHTVRPVIEARLNRQEKASGDSEDKHNSGWFALKSQDFKNRSLRERGKKEDLIVTDDPKWDMTPHWWNEEGPLISPEDEFINVIDMTASVTRNGGWCSSGSIEHRDQMVFASQYPNCIGHIFIIDTPGGSAFSKNDYQVGIEAARAAGQPVLCWIDGMCCSAGVAAACQTDEIYVMHENDEVGCIGTMAAFYTLADGTEDEEGYVYHELYDPESFEKNIEFRELANNNNPDPILKELAEDGAAFRALVKANRPGMKENMLHGKVFKAKDLMGILVDGVKTFEEVVNRVVELKSGAELIQHTAVAEEPEPQNEEGGEGEGTCGDPKKEDDNPVIPQEPEDPENPDGNEPENNSVQNDNVNTNNNIKNMKQYEHINAAVNVEMIAVTEDGSFFCNAPLAEMLDARLAQAEQNSTLLAANNETVRILNEKVKALTDAQETLKQQVSTLSEEKQKLESEIAEQNTKIVNLEAEKNTLSQEKKDLEAATDSKVSEITTQAVSEKEALTKEIEEKNQRISELEAEMTKKDEEIESLSKNTTTAPTPTPAAPGQASEQGSPRIYNEHMTPAERSKALKEAMDRLRQ